MRQSKIVCILGPAVLLIVGILSFSSCGDLDGYDEVFVIWPDGGIPAAGGSNPDYWEISWLLDDGSVASQTVPGEGRPLFSCMRERPAVLMAVPLMDDWPPGYGSYPAGCVLPARRDKTQIVHLSWVDGFAADMLLSLAESGIDPAMINVERFANAAKERIDESPWRLDIQRLTDDLRTGDLWIYSFRERPAWNVDLPLSLGEWYTSYPLDPVIIAGPSGWTGTLAQGLHRFLKPADGASVLVQVDERGDVILLEE